MFQSLSGFLVRCNSRLFVCPFHIENRFQSLSGFLVRCNFQAQACSSRNFLSFQSLSGFLVRCNSLPPVPQARTLFGFNPYRVFWFAATTQPPHKTLLDVRVSIPIGFSGSLQRLVRWPEASEWKGFQSLSGFLVRCNNMERITVSIYKVVSIPIGFSGSLQPRWN